MTILCLIKFKKKTGNLRHQVNKAYCRIVTPEKDYLLTMPMKRLEDKLPPASFQRIHRSHIVNLLRVDEVADGMVRIDKEILPLSPAMRGEFMWRLNAV